MRKRLFTQEEMDSLRRNPNVFSVTPREIRYTNAFKLHFMNRYLEGTAPRKIFEEAGFPLDLLGNKRIERAAYHWRQAYEAGELGRQKEVSADRTPEQTLFRIILEQREEIRTLKRQVTELEKQSR
ncbi:HTH domain-containing protein [Agathobaculum sp.]|uniref:HTH domain-containing protein n=1 Tax=Agathobaculum sp. TaxID=2048138 RepID=UPI002A822206|nr:HTH domain-containing protein [Agathobaculum sp.]MDY3618343.1 HTH domain-containing protein [Agathobaculum sp.]